MDIGEVLKIQLKRSHPLPIRILRLLDEVEEESDEDEVNSEEQKQNDLDGIEKLKIDDVPNNDKVAEKVNKNVDESVGVNVEQKVIANDLDKHKEDQLGSERQLSNDNAIKKEKIYDSSNKSLSIVSLPSSNARTSEMLDKNKILETPVKHMPTTSSRPVPCLSHRNIFQTPECPQMNVPSSTKSIQSVPPKQNSNYESQRYYNSEIKNMRRPLVEREAAGSYTCDPKQPYSFKASFAQMNSQNAREERREESYFKRAIFPVEQESKENRDSVNVSSDQQKPRDNVVIKAPQTVSNVMNPKVPPVNAKNTVVEGGPGKSTILSAESDQKDQKSQQENIEKPPKVQCSIPRKSEIIKNLKISVKGREYLILNVIGKGMSAEVLQAQDVETQELRAIKRVNLGMMEKECVQGCIDEIKMLYKLQASFIVRMFNYEIQRSYLYVVMELGETDLSSLLKSVILEKNKLPYSMVVHYWMEMLCAVKYIHDNGVIHSDLKPANFILVKGRLKLIDFNIASSITADCTSVIKDSQFGTLNYISPEALMDSNAHSDSNANSQYKISRKADIWSLGCILYCMVYGVTPFQHIRNQWAKINMITRPNPTISYRLKRDDSGEPIPPILIDVIQKCLQHNPKARPSADDLLKVSYIMWNKSQNTSPVNIRHSTLVKIKNALTEEEWREFIEALNKAH